MAVTKKLSGIKARLEEMSSTLAGNLRAKRDSAHLTRRALAEKCGVHEDVLQKIELGQRLPMLETIVMIAAALDVEPYELLRRE